MVVKLLPFENPNTNIKGINSRLISTCILWNVADFVVSQILIEKKQSINTNIDKV